MTRLAVVGACATGLRYAWAGGDRPWTEPLYALLAMALALLVLCVLARAGRRKLAAHPTVLVPLGVTELARTLVSLVPVQAAYVDLLRPTTLFEDSAAAVLLLLVSLALFVAGVVWQTLAIVQVLDHDQVDPAAALRATPRHLLRGTAVMVLVYAALFAVPIVAVATGIASHAPLATIAALPVVGLAVSLVGVLWLPRALDLRMPMFRAIGDATRAALARWQLSLGLLFAWAIATGMVTIHYVEVQSYGQHTTTTSWNVLTDYYAGYRTDSAWYDKLPAAAGLPSLGWYAVPLAWLFAATAVAVKLEILLRHRDAPDQYADARTQQSDVRRRSRRAAALARVRRRLARDRTD